MKSEERSTGEKNTAVKSIFIFHKFQGIYGLKISGKISESAFCPVFPQKKTYI